MNAGKIYRTITTIVRKVVRVHASSVVFTWQDGTRNEELTIVPCIIAQTIANIVLKIVDIRTNAVVQTRFLLNTWNIVLTIVTGVRVFALASVVTEIYEIRASLVVLARRCGAWNESFTVVEGGFGIMSQIFTKMAKKHPK